MRIDHTTVVHSTGPRALIAESCNETRTCRKLKVLPDARRSQSRFKDTRIYIGPIGSSGHLVDGRIRDCCAFATEGSSVESSPHCRRLTGILRSLLVFALLLSPAALAAEESEVIVGVADFPPLVMEAEDGLQGFDIDIWNRVALEIGLDSTFRVMPFGELIKAVETGEVDAAMAGISLQRDRDLVMDFSYPYMSSGLRILTSVEEKSA